MENKKCSYLEPQQHRAVSQTAFLLDCCWRGVGVETQPAQGEEHPKVTEDQRQHAKIFVNAMLLKRLYGKNDCRLWLSR